ncbi:hypothetical protein BN946_scf185043.g163 [Trametes cinnabarina]|uniref:Uncharacterized protein n=1 Tax=Pycnoporus cinnabarinus TaxID=5643 RepID=A0A060SNT3_PYCCI|nr:hypothetical protein BN946_scf185043.g163 [Trametes cinnabarina]
MTSPADELDKRVLSADSSTSTDPSSDGGFFSNILTPGSSLNPTFLLLLDGAFGLLLVVLFALFVITHWNVHLLFLMVIEGCLWASVKWFVHELQQVQTQDSKPGSGAGSATEKSPKPKTE